VVADAGGGAAAGAGARPQAHGSKLAAAAVRSGQRPFPSKDTTVLLLLLLLKMVVLRHLLLLLVVNVVVLRHLLLLLKVVILRCLLLCASHQLQLVGVHGYHLRQPCPLQELGIILRGPEAIHCHPLHDGSCCCICCC
jgi:hypothetical protein